MLLNNSILRSLGLTDPNFEFLLDDDGGFNHFERRGDDNHRVVIYRARLHGNFENCPLCGFASTLTKHGFSKETEVKLPTANGYDNRLILRKQRYHCGGNPVVTSPDLDENRNVSNPLRHQIIRLAMEDISEKVIAFILRLSHSSVHRIINEELQTYRYDYSLLPTVLSFDEIRVGRSYAFVYASPDAFQEILPNRQLKTIKDYFLGFSLKQRKAVTHVVVDMNASYASIVRGLFPNARIIVNRFHIVQLMTRAINTIRTGIQKLLDKKKHEYKVMKHCWRLFLKNYNNIEFKQRRFIIGLNEFMTEEEAITLIFKSFPVLEAAWVVYQEALEAIQEKSPTKIKALIDTYSPVGSAMDTTIGTFKSNLKGILESLRQPWSNGKIEGINRRLKQIGRTAYGFRNLANFMRRIRIQMKYPRY
ncbi:ISL3 family transposase [Weissella confusa]|uniref:ISL3 family transposase n=1 Tax=Weissella confusa TaxID=1583 RepID=UPI001C6F9035|nr:ISL3 family transposase [Weissella confusa]QYU58608.1 ISL3 family transposase [Weissella confusa]QYU58622.1 ISL3 family transposase [Weissella confusa]